MNLRFSTFNSPTYLRIACLLIFIGPRIYWLAIRHEQWRAQTDRHVKLPLLSLELIVAARLDMHMLSHAVLPCFYLSE
jgi:hypothetical protein